MNIVTKRKTRNVKMCTIYNNLSEDKTKKGMRVKNTEISLKKTKNVNMLANDIAIFCKIIF